MPNIENFKQLVADWLNNNAAVEVKEMLKSKKGEHVVVSDFIQASTHVANAVDGQIKTREELEKDGWFPEQNI